jgi:neuronal cell adhesion molecule
LFFSGYYQCFANNTLGTAKSNSVLVRKAEPVSFKDGVQNRTESVTQGTPYILKCQQPSGWPKPIVHWHIRTNYDPSNVEKSIINDSRITMGPDGNLYFSTVNRDDRSHGSYHYSCSASSTFFEEDVRTGRNVVLNVTDAVDSEHKPVLQYETSNNTVALRGEKEVKLFCIFSG